MDNGFYLYGIAGQQAAAQLPGNPGGIDQGYCLESLVLGNLSAIISQVSLAEFGKESIKQNLQNINWLERVARTHDSIVKHLASTMTVIPVRFGTVFHNAAGIEQFLRDNGNKLEHVLESLQGMCEMGVALNFKKSQVVENLQKTNQEIRELEEKAQAATSGAAYLLRKKLDSMRSATMKSFMEEQVTFLGLQLKELAREVKEGALSVLPDDDSRLYANIACLIGKDTVEQFNIKVSALAETVAGSGVSLRTTGPWPAYSFSQLDGEDNSKKRDLDYVN